MVCVISINRKLSDSIYWAVTRSNRGGQIELLDPFPLPRSPVGQSAFQHLVRRPVARPEHEDDAKEQHESRNASGVHLSSFRGSFVHFHYGII